VSGTSRAHTDPPEVTKGEAHYREGLMLAEKLGMHPLLAHCHYGLGILYAKIDRPELACAELSTATALYRTVDMALWLTRAEAALAKARC
jgi:hypothetical protein